MSKSKILFILTLPPPIHGAAAMGQYIFESELINESFECEFINLQTSRKLQHIGNVFFAKLFVFLSLYRNVISALVGKKHDLCYVSLAVDGPGFYKDFLVIFLLKLYRKNILYHFHNKGMRDNKKGGVKGILYRYLFKNTQSILLSELLYTNIKDFVSIEDVYFCPNGVPVLPHSVKVYDLTREKCSFLFLSNMMLEKGVFVLLEACKILKEKKLKFTCDFVGAWSDVTEENFNVMVTQNELIETVFVHGPKYNNEKTSHLENADVFVFPTYYRHEAFPLVNLEAMRQGLPVISTPEGGIPDIVVDGETGYLVSQHSAEELAIKMELFIHQPELRKEMGIKGKERYTHLFTLSIFEGEMIKILKDVLSRNQKS